MMKPLSSGYVRFADSVVLATVVREGGMSRGCEQRPPVPTPHHLGILFRTSSRRPEATALRWPRRGRRLPVPVGASAACSEALIPGFMRPTAVPC